MALSDRAKAGLKFAADLVPQTVDEFKEAKLEALGLEWAETAERALASKRVQKLAKAPKTLTDALDALPE